MPLTSYSGSSSFHLSHSSSQSLTLVNHLLSLFIVNSSSSLLLLHSVLFSSSSLLLPPFFSSHLSLFLNLLELFIVSLLPCTVPSHPLPLRYSSFLLIVIDDTFLFTLSHLLPSTLPLSSLHPLLSLFCLTVLLSYRVPSIVVFSSFFFHLSREHLLFLSLCPVPFLSSPTLLYSPSQSSPSSSLFHLFLVNIFFLFLSILLPILSSRVCTSSHSTLQSRTPTRWDLHHNFFSPSIYTLLPSHSPCPPYHSTLHEIFTIFFRYYFTLHLHTLLCHLIFPTLLTLSLSPTIFYSSC